MIFQEKRCFLSELFSEEAEVGWYAVIEPFTVPAAEVKFNGSTIQVPEFTTEETKLYCIDKKDGKTQFLFDNAMFQMPIAPFKDGKEVCFKNSFLKKYLKKVFVPVFCQVYDLEKIKIRCDIPSNDDVFDEEKKLAWFTEPKHKIAMFDGLSRWWWLSTKYQDDDEDASAARFCTVGSNGLADYRYASTADGYVRPRFVIGAQAKD